MKVKIHRLLLNTAYPFIAVITLATALFLLVVRCSRISENKRLSSEQFTDLLTQVSDGWNAGDARKAADVFAEDAIYEEPPKKQYYQGQASIFEFFGGKKGLPRPMKMNWHHIAFNEQTQIGFGEYSFAMNKQYHGIATIKIKNKKIAVWREYQYESSMDWGTFSGEGNVSK
ncbi:nuclear transport factor 2 family protein [Dyadobacter sp. MSC1_007]|jgi:ketosteroid isomerase-like protein|uniref:nuclear transport factor 2 family protein n=1 Tax=Dyadobacter sp. MSC1_007 TaxID=2909264 RepID=UPI002030200D|nr:nuclear transport factor 2 family protein [Dyadobacter sp. MSC1_007]